MIALPPSLSEYVQAKVDSGEYASEEDVLFAAFDAFQRSEEQVRREADLASIKRGLADFEAGRFRTAEEADAEFRQRHGLDPSP